MRHLTVRNVPDDVARLLARETRETGRSLNQTVIDLLRRALGLGPGAQYDNGLRDLAGGWSENDAAEFENATRPFEDVDEEMWK
jgi:hypothetical protein